MSLPTSVLQLGKRARLRFEEERSKRPEIVVLEHEESLRIPEGSSKKQSKIKLPSVRRSKPITIHPNSNNKNNRSKISKGERIDVSSSLFISSKKRILETSNHVTGKGQSCETSFNESHVVRIEGLPSDIGTPELIRRFFSGLPKIDRIVILPSLNVSIREWGENSVCSDRIFVRFASPHIAMAAAQRSQEYLLLEDQRRKVIITVTIVPHNVGEYLVQNLAMDAIQTGVTLRKQRLQTESKIVPSILDYLWTCTIRDLNLTSAYPWMQKANTYPWRKERILQKKFNLIEYHRSLENEYTKMEQSGGVWSIESRDLQIMDPVIRLYDLGIKRLRLEIDKVYNDILRASYEKSRL
jgi:hypothetical protein